MFYLKILGTLLLPIFLAFFVMSFLGLIGVVGDLSSTGLFFLWQKLGSNFLPVGILCSSMCVIIISNPIYALICLIIIFFSTAVFLLSLNVKFLGMIYLIIYIGAIAILFLFVIMMFNLRELKQQLVHLNDYNVVVISFGIYFLMLWKFYSLLLNYILRYVEYDKYVHDFASRKFENLQYFLTYQHADTLLFGTLLYQYYSFLFLVAALILLTSMLGSIVLALSTTEKSYTLLNATNKKHKSSLPSLPVLLATMPGAPGGGGDGNGADIIFIILVAVVVGLCGYFFFAKKKEEPKEDANKNSSTDSNKESDKTLDKTSGEASSKSDETNTVPKSPSDTESNTIWDSISDFFSDITSNDDDVLIWLATQLKDLYYIWPLTQWVYSLVGLIVIYWVSGKSYNQFLKKHTGGTWLSTKARAWLITSDLLINLTLGVYYMQHRNALLGPLMMKCPIAISPVIFTLELIGVACYYYILKTPRGMAFAETCKKKFLFCYAYILPIIDFVKKYYTKILDYCGIKSEKQSVRLGYLFGVVLLFIVLYFIVVIFFSSHRFTKFVLLTLLWLLIACLIVWLAIAFVYKKDNSSRVEKDDTQDKKNNTKNKKDDPEDKVVIHL